MLADQPRSAGNGTVEAGDQGLDGVEPDVPFLQCLAQKVAQPAELFQPNLYKTCQP